MQRRDFFWQTGLIGMATLTTGIKLSGNSGSPELSEAESVLPILKPRRLHPGDTVALIAPGSPLSNERVAKAIANLQNLGLKVREGRHLREEYGYLAGSDAHRLADLHWAFRDPEIDGIWCARGGYGCTRLLGSIDYNLIKNNPKLFIGYSDVTALHLAFYQRTGLVPFHGPVAAANWQGDAIDHIKATVFNPTQSYTLKFVERIALSSRESVPAPFSIRAGIATGVLTGGNLSLLAAMAGTPDSPKFAGKIVFIEDIEEEPYRIDRMLTQLLQATDLKKAAGIALGIFSDCKPDGKAPSLTLRQALKDRLSWLTMPVAYGFPCGHIDFQATIPYGIRARLDAGVGRLVFLETAVL